MISSLRSYSSNLPPGKTQAPPKLVFIDLCIKKTSTASEIDFTSKTVAAGLGIEGGEPGSAFWIFILLLPVKSLFYDSSSDIDLNFRFCFSLYIIYLMKRYTNWFTEK